MFASTSSFLDHAKSLRVAARAAGAELIYAGDSLAALLRKGNRHVVLYPQFLLVHEGAVRRTPALHDLSQEFLGFLPYETRHWPLANDRLAFKRHCAQLGLPVPALPAGGDSPADFVVRRAEPSFEPFVRGPFRRAEDHPLDASKREFYEPYVEGDSLTAWFWGGRPICAAVATTPAVTGDGKTALGELVVRSSQAGGAMLSALALQLQLAEAQAIARYRGLELASVPAPGSRLVVGLGHGSPLLGTRELRTFDLGASSDLPWVQSLRRAGEALRDALPEDAREGTLYALRATIDAEGRAWFIDMDASPYVNPLVYGTMVASLLGGESRAEERRSPSERAPS